MRRLSLSLLLVVIVAIIGAGWAMDRLFARLDQGGGDSLQMAEQFGYRLVSLLDGVENLPLGTSSDFPTASPLPENAEAYDVHIASRDSIILPPVLDAQLVDGRVVVLQSMHGVTLHFLMPESQRIVVLGIPEQPESGTALRLLLTIVFYASIVLLVLVWLYPLIRRLQKLALATRLVGEGDLSQRIDTNKRSQLHDIESEFNAMAQRIQVLMEDNRMLSSAVSHDLRTPLARLRFGVDALAETPLDARQSDYLARLSVDLDRMEQLVSVLLEFARLEQRLEDLPRTPLALDSVIRRAVEMAVSQGGKEIDLRIETNSPVILADEGPILMLVDNLVQNAMKFSRHKTRVTLGRQGNELCLMVEDDGPGFPESGAERLLQPFQKGEADAHADERRGYGLGLAIVERIARWQHARVILGRSIELQGACVTVAFRPA